MEKRKGPAPFGYGFLALTISLACSGLIPDAIAQTYLDLLQQPRSAWSWEIELRPWVERF